MFDFGLNNWVLWWQQMPQIPLDFDAIVQLKKYCAENRMLYWRSTLFSPQWWFSIAMGLCSILLWLKLVNRAKLVELVLYGLLWALTATFLDEIGPNLVWWEYPYTLLPVGSKNLSANLTTVPVVFMLIYQYYPSIKSFAWATIGIAVLFAFVFEPFLVWFGIYKLYHWTYYYSFVLYIIFSFAFRWITKKLFAIQYRHEERQ